MHRMGQITMIPQTDCCLALFKQLSASVEELSADSCPTEI